MNSSASQSKECDLDQKLEKLFQAFTLNQTLVQKFLLKRQEVIGRLDSIQSDEEDGEGEYDFGRISYKDFSRKSNIVLSIREFHRPYLRDQRGLSAPLLFNPEHDFVIDPNVQSFLINPRIKCRWTLKDEKIILQEVCTQNVFKKSCAIIKRLEEIAKTSEPPRPYSVEQLKEINQLETELVSIRAKQEEPERFSQDIDWLIIAKHLNEDDDRTDEDCELYYNNHLHSSINHEPWSEDEDVKLMELVEKHGEHDWDFISEQLQTKRLPWQCCQRFQIKYSPVIKRKGPLVEEEQQWLKQIICECQNNGIIDWKRVENLYEGRTVPQIKYFHQKQNKSFKNIPWTSLEDKLLYACVNYYGPSKFKQISKHLPLRNNVQVRERYVYRMSMHINQQQHVLGNWKPEEDLELVKHCADCLKNKIKTDYVKLWREKFPQRNPHQLFQRFAKIRQELPEDFYLKPIDLNMMKKFSMFKTRRRFCKPFTPPKLPENRQELYQFILKLSKRLLQQRDNTARDILNISNPLITLNQSNSDYNLSYIDACLVLYKRLQPFYRQFQRCFIRVTKLDLHVNRLFLKIVPEMLTHEILDDNDDEQRHENYADDLVLLAPEKEPEIDYDYDLSLTLDTFRLFLSLKCSSINVNYDQNQLRCLFLPNKMTIYGYATMQLLYHAMLINEAESSLDDGQENDTDDANYTDSIVEEEDFKELQSTFLSLFLWPAMLTIYDVHEQIFLSKIDSSKQDDKQQILATTITEVKDDGDDNRNDIVEYKRKRGRPPKRKFFKQIDEFTRVRSMQTQLFYSPWNYDDLAIGIQDVYYDSSRSFWIHPPLMTRLIERVCMFLELIREKVEQTYEQKPRNDSKKIRRISKQVSTTKSSSKTLSNKLEQSSSSSSSSIMIVQKNDPIPVVRRSNRLSQKHAHCR